jgi:hypothetical protein
MPWSHVVGRIRQVPPGTDVVVPEYRTPLHLL